MARECTTKLLKSIYKNSNQGIKTVNYLIPKVKEGSFKKYLLKQQDIYLKYIVQTENEMNQRKIKFKKNQKVQDLLSWAKVQFGVLRNKSETSIAEMIIENSTEVIIDTTKKVKNYSTSDEDVLNIANGFIKSQQVNIDNLKTYL